MVTAKQIYDYIDSIAPFETAMSFDNVGILVGSRSAQSERVLLALDATKAVLEEAKAGNINIVVTHHPVIFDPLRQLAQDSIPYIAARNDITVISAHTNLDIARGGVNELLARTAGVNAEEYFDEHCALIGSLENEASPFELAESIKAGMKLRGLRYTDSGRKLKKVMVSCGAGGSNIFLAAELGADAFITGEIKHHEIVFANDSNIAVFDLGHFQSEDMVIPALAEMLKKAFPDTDFLQAENDSDKVNYLS